MAIKRRTKKSSRGERNSIDRGLVQAVKANRTPGTKQINILQAWREGKNPWVTIPTHEKNKPFIRVKANDVWGMFKKVKYASYTGKASKEMSR